MNSAAKSSIEFDDQIDRNDEAESQAQSITGTDLTLYESDFDDEDWLDEELSDEELAALGEEDFADEFEDEFDTEDEPIAQLSYIEGDLENTDSLDDFDLLEPSDGDIQVGEASIEDVVEIADDSVVTAPVNDAAETTTDALDDDLPPPIADENLFSDTTETDYVADDDSLFNLEEDYTDPTDISGANIDEDLNASDPVSEAIPNEDTFDPVGDDDGNIDLEMDDAFAIDEDYEDSQTNGHVANAVVPRDKTHEVDVKEEGKVAEADAADAIQEDDVKAEPSFKDEGDEALDEFEDDGSFHRPVPRISIHAFCETENNSAMLERAAVDRRLSKAHFTMHMGGLEKAIDLYQTSSTPNLIILETVIGGKVLLQQLGQLAEVCDPSTKVVIIGHINDIRLYRELIRSGISEYIIRPKSPLQVIKTISELYVDPSAPPIGKTIAFVGTRGGVGSSTIAHNMAWAVAENFESDTILLDLDLPFGTAALDFDHEPSSGLMEALTSPERLDDVLLERLLQKHTDHLSLFTAPNMLDRDYDIADDAFDTVVDVVRGAAPNIMIDVPHNWTGWSKKILQTADEIVITATPDFASFRNMKYLLEVIGSARPNDSRPYFVYNQYDPKHSAVPVEYFVENVDLEPSLVLGWEPQLFNSAATNASPLIELNPKSKVATGLNDLAAKIIGRTEILALPSRFSLKSLFKRK